uniref:Homing endonuclease LAGLIDADG domain-containing protein n=1 Tax=Tremella fuciformis TaxID=64657 RepID=A0A2H4QBR8_9TREE|nr:hypothetical protein [Tremella fuciformis]
MFVGFVDGDGYIKLTRTVTGHISMELVIALNVRDLPLLQYMHSVLGIGRINQFGNTVKYIIGRVDLQEVLFPLLLHHNIFFLTHTRRLQYALALHVLMNNIVLFGDLPTGNNNQYLGLIPSLPNTAMNFTVLPFFFNWIVGFTMAEGSFYIKSVGEYFFSLRQRTFGHTELFEAFRLVFNTQTSVEYSTRGYAKFAVSSVKDLTTVVTFFSHSGLHPLVGHKLEQYNKWINGMRSTKRFSSIKLPDSSSDG